MVNPVGGPAPRFFKAPAKKKPVKEVDVRVKKAAINSRASRSQKVGGVIKVSQKALAEKGYLAAEKASNEARRKAIETQRAAVKAQKAAFLSQRAQMMQQSAAIKRARAAAQAKRAAERVARRAAALRRTAKIKAYQAKPEVKKRDRVFKKYVPSSPKKKKNS